MTGKILVISNQHANQGNARKVTERLSPTSRHYPAKDSHLRSITIEVVPGVIHAAVPPSRRKG